MEMRESEKSNIDVVHLFTFCLLGLSGVARVSRKLPNDHLSHEKLYLVKLDGKNCFTNFVALCLNCLINSKDIRITVGV